MHPLHPSPQMHVPSFIQPSGPGGDPSPSPPGMQSLPCAVLCCPQHWLSSRRPSTHVLSIVLCTCPPCGRFWPSRAVVSVFLKGWGGRAIGGAYLTEYEFSLECALCYSWCVHCYGSIVSIMVLKILNTRLGLLEYCCLVAKSCLTLWPHGLKYSKLLCPLLSPGVCSNSCPSTQWCYLTIFSSATLFSFPIIMVFSNESALRIRWPKYWSFSFSISPSNEYSGLISLQSKGLSSYYSRINQMHCYYYLLIRVWFFVTPWTPWTPARLLCPWNFLGKNTGVGYHFLLQIKCISLTKHRCKLLNSMNSFIRFVLGSIYFEYQSCCLK